MEGDSTVLQDSFYSDLLKVLSLSKVRFRGLQAPIEVGLDSPFSPVPRHFQYASEYSNRDVNFVLYRFFQGYFHELYAFYPALYTLHFSLFHLLNIHIPPYKI